jgi:hypothetical protein
MSEEKNMWNDTTIIFNDKLKSLYDDIHENHIDLIDQLSDISRCTFANPEMRLVFDKNKDKLDYSTDIVKFKRQEYFALICGLVSDYNNYNRWEQIMNYFDDVKAKIIVFTNDYDEDIRNYGNYNTTCICGQPIKEICYLYKDGKIKLIIGNVCVKKYIITNKKHPLYKKFKKERKKLKEQKKIYKQKKEEYEKLISEFRKCNDCNKYNISINEPSYKKICLECFKSKNKHKPKTLVEKMKTHKQCVNCNEYKVKKEYERMKYCWDCTKQCSNPDCKKRILAKYSFCFNCK